MKIPAENVIADIGRKSGQEVANEKKARNASTRGSLAHLKSRIRSNTATYFGRASHVPFFVIRLKHGRQRKHFQLKLNLDDSAELAAEIMAHLRLHGWAKTAEVYRPREGRKTSDLTVGEYLELLSQHSELEPLTLENYASCLRRVVSGITNLKHKGSDKFAGGRAHSAWRAAVDKVLLDQITPTAVVRWRSKYVRDRVAAGRKQEYVEHTVNSTIRNARSLFAKRVLHALKLAVPTLSLPSPLPFEGVPLLKEHESDFFYHSTIDVTALIEKAFAELFGEELVIFTLAIGGGLRRKEIDNLEWCHVNLANRTVAIMKPRNGRLKTDSSCGIVVLEKRFADVLEAHARRGNTGYVLFPDRAALHRAKTRRYRCNTELNRVLNWLRQNGVNNSDKPLHTMRKEFGSNIAKHKGIYAASASLRHSTIALTAKYYAQRKAEETSFFNAEQPSTGGLTESDMQKLLTMMKAQGLVVKVS